MYDLVLKLPYANFHPGHLVVRTLSDADFAGDLYTSKSTSGYCSFLEDTITPSRPLIDWSSKLQSCVTANTPDSELAAIHRSTVRSSIPIQLLVESFYGFETPIYHLCDNKPSLHTIDNGASDALRYLAKTQRISIPLLSDIFSADANMIDFVDQISVTSSQSS